MKTKSSYKCLRCSNNVDLFNIFCSPECELAEPAKKKKLRNRHSYNGNCVEYSCVFCFGTCGVCHQHQRQRGDCPECNRCDGCIGTLMPGDSIYLDG